LGQSWLLDVAPLPAPYPWPTTSAGARRASGRHYADLQPPWVTIHSEPYDTELIPAERFFSESAPGTDGADLGDLERLVQRPWTSRGAVALFLPS
jgi:hypothetical protein